MQAMHVQVVKSESKSEPYFYERFAQKTFLLENIVRVLLTEKQAVVELDPFHLAQRS